MSHCLPNSLTLPVTRSSKRTPTPIMASHWVIAWLAVQVPCMPGMPSHIG